MIAQKVHPFHLSTGAAASLNSNFPPNCTSVAMAYNVGNGDGLETHRKLYETFHPWVASRYVGSLALFLATKINVGDLASELDTFDATIRRYETESWQAHR